MFFYKKISNNLELWSRRTPHKDLVTSTGFIYLPFWYKYNELEIDFLTYMLDKGTISHSKKDLALALESLGCRLIFSVNNGYLTFVAQCLKKDISVVYGYIYEMLTESVFPEEEFIIWKKLILSSLIEDKSDPASLVNISLSQAIYPKNHPSYQENIDDEIAFLNAMDLNLIKSKFDNILSGKMKIIAVGDVDELELEKSLALWKFNDEVYHDQLPVFETLEVSSKRTIIDIPAKINLEVRFGQYIDLNLHSENYWAFLLAVDALGGGFNARLMRTVRDEEGLTYGVYAGLSGGIPELGSLFTISITLSAANLDIGIESVMKQLKRWYDFGLTENELAARKDGLLGRHVVGSTKTSQIASFMRYGVMFDFGVDYSSYYMSKINNVKLVDVNQSIRELVDNDRWVIVSAGEHG